MEYTKLSNDVRVPLLGLGTFMISPDDTETSVYEALKMAIASSIRPTPILTKKLSGRALRKPWMEVW